MSNFVFDGLPVPETKTNLNPVQGLSINSLSATEFNLITQYLNDISSAIRLGNYHGLASNPTEGVALTGQLKVRYNATSGEFEVSREGKSWATVDNVVDVRRFGVLRVEDGMSDCSPALQVLKAYLLSVNNKIVYFPPGTYKFKSAYFFANMAGGHTFKMYGVKWGCTWYVHGGDGSIGDGNWLPDESSIVMGDMFVDIPAAPTSWAQVIDAAPFYLNCQWYPFQTTQPQGPNYPSNTFSLTTTLASDAGNFQAGDRVWMGGYNIQSLSGPSSNRYYETATVKTANAATGVITFEQPLKNVYNGSWKNGDVSPLLNPQPAWVGSHAYTLGQYVQAPNYGVYVCTTAGTSSASTPPTVTTTGGTQTDGTVTWTYYGDSSNQYRKEPLVGSNWLASWYPQYARFGSVRSSTLMEAWLALQ